jgi:APA family basic amino acid/polyamine antiporter
LGIISLVCLVVANMIGAGVYTSSGFALADLQSRSLVLVCWAVAGGIALMGAYCYGYLTRAITASGGEYLFLSRGVHPLAGFMAGWISLTAGFSGAIAYAAITFEVYLPETGWREAIPAGVIPATLIAIFSAIHLIGLSTGAGVQNGLVAIKVVFLVGFTTWGLIALASWSDSAAQSEQHIATIVAQTPRSIPWGAIANSVMWTSFSYAGYNASVYVAGASRNGTTVARSMWVATILVTLIYLSLNFVIMFSVPTEELAGQKDVLNIAALAVGGPWMQRAMSGVILLSLATSVSAMIQAGPHVYAQMARDGLLPRFFSAAEDAVPRRAVILQMVLAIGLALFSSLQSLLDYLSFLLTISAAATVAILLVPRFRRQHAVVGGAKVTLVASVFVVASLGIAALSLNYRLTSDPWGLVQALLVIPAGLIAYVIFAWLGRQNRNSAPPPL